MLTFSEVIKSDVGRYLAYASIDGKAAGCVVGHSKDEARQQVEYWTARPDEWAEWARVRGYRC